VIPAPGIHIKDLLIVGKFKVLVEDVRKPLRPFGRNNEVAQKREFSLCFAHSYI
jgi:hypothetical protein